MTRASVDTAHKSPRPTEPAQVVQEAADPEAWGIARLYANGDVRRLQVIDRNTVLVRNNPPA